MNSNQISITESFKKKNLIHWFIGVYFFYFIALMVGNIGFYIYSQIRKEVYYSLSVDTFSEIAGAILIFIIFIFLAKVIKNPSQNTPIYMISLLFVLFTFSLYNLIYTSFSNINDFITIHRHSPSLFDQTVTIVIIINLIKSIFFILFIYQLIRSFKRVVHIDFFVNIFTLFIIMYHIYFIYHMFTERSNLNYNLHDSYTIYIFVRSYFTRFITLVIDILWIIFMFHFKNSNSTRYNNYYEDNTEVPVEGLKKNNEFIYTALKKSGAIYMMIISLTIIFLIIYYLLFKYIGQYNWSLIFMNMNFISLETLVGVELFIFIIMGIMIVTKKINFFIPISILLAMIFYDFMNGLLILIYVIINVSIHFNPILLSNEIFLQLSTSFINLFVSLLFYLFILIVFISYFKNISKHFLTTFLLIASAVIIFNDLWVIFRYGIPYIQNARHDLSSNLFVGAFLLYVIVPSIFWLMFMWNYERAYWDKEKL